MGIKRKIQKEIQQRKIEVVFTNECPYPLPQWPFHRGRIAEEEQIVRFASL